MYSLNRLTIVFALTSLLSACGGGGGGDSESPSPSYSGTLTKSGYWYGEQSYIQLNQDAPSAVAECNECSTQNFSYTWQIDMDDDGVFDGEADVEYQQTSYAPNRLEYAKSVRLIATHDEIKEPLINIYHPTEMVKEIISNDRGGEVFAALKTDGNAVIWGNERMGGDTSLNGTDKLSNVRSIHISSLAVAAIKQDNSVEVWGQSTHGGDASLVQDKLNNITNIYSNAYSMVALNSEGGVVAAWGDPNDGSDGNTSYQGNGGEIPAEKAELLKSGIISITPVRQGAYVALKEDGTVVTWGNDMYGAQSLAEDSALPKISSLYANQHAIAAIDINGNAIAWGGKDREYGGDTTTNNQKVLSNITNIVSTTFNYGAFAALTKEGEVIAWGAASRGANEPALTNIQQLYSSPGAFVALDADGNATVWGHEDHGGNSGNVDLTNIRTVYPATFDFVAVKNDGSVIHWGWADANPDSPHVIPMPEGLSNIESFTASEGALVALKQGGTLAVWGFDDRSDKNDQNEIGNFGAIADKVEDQLHHIAHVYNTRYALAAVSLDGRVITWGKSDAGGDSEAVKELLVAKAEAEVKQ